MKPYPDEFGTPPGPDYGTAALLWGLLILVAVLSGIAAGMMGDLL